MSLCWLGEGPQSQLLYGHCHADPTPLVRNGMLSTISLATDSLHVSSVHELVVGP